MPIVVTSLGLSFAQDNLQEMLLRPTAVPQLVVQAQHSGDITSLSLSSDGQFVLSASTDGSARLWEFGTGNLIRQFSWSRAELYSAAISPDDKMVAVGSQDHSTRVFDMSTGQEIYKIQDRLEVRQVAFSPDNRLLLTVSLSASVWDAHTGALIRTFGKSSDVIEDAAISPDSTLIATASSAAGVTVWKMATGEKVKELGTHSALAAHLAFLPQGDQLLVDSMYGTYLWDVNKGDELRQVGKYSGGRAFALSKSGDYLFNEALGVENGNERATSLLRDVKSGQVRLQISDPYDAVFTAAVFSPDGHYLVTGSLRNTLRMWDISTGREVRTFGTIPRTSSVVAYSPDGRDVLVANSDNTVQLWDLRAGRPTFTMRGFTDWIRFLRFSSDGTLALVGAGSSTALWDLRSRKLLQRFASKSWQMVDAAISPDQRLVVTTDGAAMLWDSVTGGLIRQFGPFGQDPQTEYCSAVAFSPDGKTVLTAQGSYFVEMWDTTTGMKIRGFSGEVLAENRLPISADGQLILGRSVEKERDFGDIWNLTTGRLLRTFKWPNYGGFNDVAVSRDGSLMLSASIFNQWDSVARLWNTLDGKNVQQFSGHGDDVQSVGMSPDGAFVFTGSRDYTARFWNMRTGKEICKIIDLPKESWAVVAPDGRFDTNNLEGIQSLRWSLADEPFKSFGLEIFERSYFVPGLLRILLANKPPVSPPVSPPLASLNRAQPTVEILDFQREQSGPAVSTASIVPVGEQDFVLGQDSGERATVTVRVQSRLSTVQRDDAGMPLRSGVYDVRLFRDGQLVGQWPKDAGGGALNISAAPSEAEREQWRQQHCVALDSNGQATITFPNIRLPQRKGADHATFTAYAFNSDRVKSETSPPRVYKFSPPAQPRPRRAYLITMGVNATQASGPWELSVAVPSAREAAQLWRERLNNEYEVVEISLISDLDANGGIAQSDATKANLSAIMDLLAGREQQVSAALRQTVDPERKLRPATPDDAVVLHVASHGYADSQGRFYLIPFDTGTPRGIDEQVLTRCQSKPDGSVLCRLAESFLSHAISSDDLAGWWAGVDGGEMVMVLDSCHSGAAPGQGFRPGPLGDRGFGQLAYDKGLRIFAATQPDKVARGTTVQGSATLLIEALSTAAATAAGQSISVWLRAAERMLPQRAHLLYPTLNEDDLQWPELLDFRQEPDTD